MPSRSTPPQHTSHTLLRQLKHARVLSKEECQVGSFDAASIGRCSEEIDSDGIGIKQFFMVTEMARAQGVPVSHSAFAEGLRSYGL
jgi:hypothetical protein